MKHLLTLLSLLVIATSYGQKKERKKNRKKNKGDAAYHMDIMYLKEYFTGLDSTQVEQRVSELIKLPKREFVKNEWRFPLSGNSSYYSFFRKDTMNEDKDYKWGQSLRFNLASYVKGGNVNLEIGGKFGYDIQSITGKYMDVFYIWQKYFRNDTTLEELLIDGNKRFSYFEGRKTIAIFRIGEKGVWSIDIQMY